MKRLISIVLFLLFIQSPFKAEDLYKYRVLFSDKDPIQSMLNEPDQLLSSRALSRRRNQQIPIDWYDLPVAQAYKDSLEKAHFHVVCTSRWLNSAVISTNDSVSVKALKNFPFVDSIQLVWLKKDALNKVSVKNKEVRAEQKYSGIPNLQLTQLQGDQLHEAGFRGEGMQIAILDAGFTNVNLINSLDSLVLGTRDFVSTENEIYSSDSHGTSVFSIMGAPAEEAFSGTAPEARYWLFRTEDAPTEYPVEEDYWVAAAEYADSLGVDIINSSLGYFTFDDPSMNHTYKDLQTHQTFISKGANRAASKGMIVVNSAGNEGATTWKYISVPADDPKILTVGAVSSSLDPAYFTSVGFVHSDCVKPTLSALGYPTYAYNIEGNLSQVTGTSFSTPVISGLAACLWQALPNLKSHEIIQLLIDHSSSVQNPDSLRGYGIPNVYEAYQSQITQVEELFKDKSQIELFPLDTLKQLWTIQGLPSHLQQVSWTLFNLNGIMLQQHTLSSSKPILDLSSVSRGTYILTLREASFYYSKLIHIQ